MNQRQKEILKILTEDQELSVSELSDQFSVSGVTIRQDLDYLQSQGLLRRVHGGAVLHSQDDIAHRLSINYEKKLAIADRAAQFISEGDTLFIEAGSTNAILARQLASRSDIRVVTNNLFVARSLKQSSVNVLVLGGVYQHDSECIVGGLAKLGLSELNFDKAFIGLDGFTFEEGLTCSDMMRTEITSMVVGKARETFVLTDSPKFGRVALTQICNVEEVDHVITDGGIPRHYVDHLAEYDVELTVTEQ